MFHDFCFVLFRLVLCRAGSGPPFQSAPKLDIIKKLCKRFSVHNGSFLKKVGNWSEKRACQCYTEWWEQEK